jgi:UTP--glucose-1-phosphate uridylyltransferase
MGFWRATLTSEIFPLLEKIKPGKSGEYPITDAFLELAQQGKLFGYLSDENVKLFDIGDKIGYAEANLYFTINKIE